MRSGLSDGQKRALWVNASLSNLLRERYGFERGNQKKKGLLDNNGIIVAAALYLTFAYNSLVRMRNSVENAWRQIDVQLKRRHDLIPNLVEAVKGYMSFERDTLTQVVEARAKAVNAPDQASRMAAENQITAGMGKLLAVMENYPQLKSDASVMQLQEELTTT